jgi:phospholipid/cholesterol/gamma-HCH transport system substrate-binding protein
VAGTLDSAAPEVKASFDGIARLSRTVASRDEDIQQLLQSSRQVTSVLDARKKDIVDLMHHSDLVFQELQKRKQAVHDLLINARQLADELRGVAKDNEKQIGPALDQVDGLLSMLVDRKDQQVLHQIGPYVSILSNIVGTGPWFDAYASNLAALPTGEFVPGFGSWN